MEQKHLYVIRQKMSLEAVIRCESLNAITRQQIRIGKVPFAERLQSETAIQEAEHKLMRLELHLTI